MITQPILGIFRKKYSEEFEYKAPHYREAYEQIISALQAAGVYVAILMRQDSYLGKGRFTKHWVQVKDSKGYHFEAKGPIAVDALYDKEHFDSDGHVLQINDQRLTDICWSKEKTYEILGGFHPQTVQAHTTQELQTAIQAMPGDKVALKELTGSSGEGVYVGPKTKAASTQLKLPVLVQEYIETAGGIPGITSKRHDIRVILAGGVPIAATLRTPPEGGFKSNIGYGGENRLLDIADLPKELLHLCTQIDDRLEEYGRLRLYSVDFGLTPNGWRMFEANGTPGVLAQSRGKQAVIYQEKLVAFLKKAAVMGQNERLRG